MPGPKICHGKQIGCHVVYYRRRWAPASQSPVLNFRKFKVTLNPLHRNFLNFPKSYVFTVDIRQLTQRRRRRQGRRQLKNELLFYKPNSRLSGCNDGIYYKWKYQNLIISRCCFAVDGKEMYKDL